MNKKPPSLAEKYEQYSKNASAKAAQAFGRAAEEWATVAEMWAIKAKRAKASAP